MCQLSRLQRTVALGLAYSVVQRQKMTLAATAAWGNLSLQRPTAGSPTWIQLLWCGTSSTDGANGVMYRHASGDRGCFCVSGGVWWL